MRKFGKKHLEYLEIPRSEYFKSEINPYELSSIISGPEESKTEDEMYSILTSEINYKLTRIEGFLCFIGRSMISGAYHGYIGLQKGHDLYGYSKKDLNNILKVHGGVTYADHKLSVIDNSLFNEPLFWIGFDCSHSSDYKPFLRYNKGEPDTYRTFDYVLNELDFLANQLKQNDGSFFF